MDKIMGNQQGTVSDVELGWFAGILDGEGSIGISRLMSHRKNMTLTPRISIGNTNIKIIDYVRDILIRIPTTFFVEKRQTKIGKNWKNANVIQISHIQGAKDVLDIITPFLVGKKQQAEILLSFVNSRLDLYRKIGRTPGSGGRGTPYTEKEKYLCEQIRILNKKGL
jgi:hypothetical protein